MVKKASKKKAVTTAKKKVVATLKKVVAKAKTKAAAPVAPSSMPSIGDAAPALSLLIGERETVRLADFKGSQNVVLYFYPKDDTPGCTKQACAFQQDLKKLTSAGAVVIGVSPDPLARHAKFKTKYGLDFTLAADDGAAAAKTFGVWVEKALYGRRYMGVQRATFLIDKRGKVAAVWPKVKVEGHSQEVLEALRAL